MGQIWGNKDDLKSKISADLIMSRTIHRKSPEFIASNDQNVILSKTVTLSKASFAPKSGNFGNFEYRLYFQIPRETFVALSV